MVCAGGGAGCVGGPGGGALLLVLDHQLRPDVGSVRRPRAGGRGAGGHLQVYPAVQVRYTAPNTSNDTTNTPVFLCEWPLDTTQTNQQGLHKGHHKIKKVLLSHAAY